MMLSSARIAQQSWQRASLLVVERHGVRAHVSLDIFPHVLARPVLEELDGIALLSFTTTPANPIQLVAKRGIDFAFSLAFVLAATSNFVWNRVWTFLDWHLDPFHAEMHSSTR